MSEGAGLSTNHWREALEHFERLSELTQNAHEAELRKVEQERPDLYPHVVTLLRAHREVQGGDFMTRVRDASLDDLRKAAASDAQPGREFGPYRLERPLGRGGMGEVWLARRADGLFVAPVALKLLHRHLEASATRERFVREGKILGQLSHPHIARLLDAGSLPGSRLYLAIEYVEGERIDLWCDLQRLTVEARVRLFLQVCEAVAHAHTRLVVHRDLKPSNIMVTASGEVKLLDFGIAKLIESEETSSEATDLTRMGGRVMTPEFAAPEQILGAPMTTATDVYSLGMVLYVLLTGRRPYGAEGASLQQLERDVVEADPDPPSHYRRMAGAVTATDAAGLRSMTGTQLRSALRGDLDTIVLKALKKAPAERYASVADFGEDLRRFVENRPVLAQPDSAGYRFRKFVRRNRVGVAAAVAVSLAIVVGVVGVVYQAREARIAQHAAERAQAQAVENATRVKRSKDFFVQVFSDASPLYRKGDGVQTIEEALDDAIARVDTDLADDPRFQGDLLSDLGEIRAGQGDIEGAKTMFERAVALHEKALPPDDPILANTLTNRGVIDSYLGKAADGIPRLERAVRILEGHADTHDAELANARAALANAYWTGHQRERALALQRVVLEQTRASPGPNERNLAAVLSSAAIFSIDLRRYAEAKGYFEEALTVWERNYGPDSSNLAVVLEGLSILAGHERDSERARAYTQRWLAITRKQYPGPNPYTLHALRGVAESETAVGDMASGVKHFREAVEMGEALESPPADLAAVYAQLAGIELERDSLAVAVGWHEKAAVLCGPMELRDNDLGCPLAAGMRARYLVAVGQYAEAFDLADRTLTTLVEAQESDHYAAEPARAARADALWGLGRRDEAVVALRGIVETPGPGGDIGVSAQGEAARRLATVLIEMGGDTHLREAGEVLSAAEDNSKRFDNLAAHRVVEARLALARGHRADAVRLLREALKILEPQRPWVDREYRMTREFLAGIERT